MPHSDTATSMPLYSTLGGDPDLGELVEMFVDEMPERIAALDDLFSRPQRDPLQRMAHQLKGAAGGYGFAEISYRAARLEEAVREDRPEADIQQALDELIDLCRRARAGVPG